MIRFSVVVNTYNRGNYIDNALHGLLELNYRDFEIVVVNGPSTDNTNAVLDRWSDRIKVGQCPEPNLSMSRNIGIALSGGDVVAFLDDDAVPHPEWLNQLARHYSNPGVGAVGGFTIDNTGVAYQARKTLCDRFGNAYFPNDFFDERQLSFPGSPIYPSLLGTNSSFRMDALRAIRGFDHVFAYLLDETDVCLRIIDEGYAVICEPNALVFHQFAPSHIRNADRIPKTLYPSAVSKSYFIQRHGAIHNTQLVAEQLSRYEQDILTANKWLLDNRKITEQHRLSLDDDLLVGIREGTRRYREKTTAGEKPVGDLNTSGNPPSFTPVAVDPGLTIALVSHSYPPTDESGIARWTSMMARGLADRGHKVHVITRAATSASTRYESGYWIHAIDEKGSPAATKLAIARGIPEGLVAWSAAVYDAIRTLSSFGLQVVSFPIWDIQGMLLAGMDSIGTVMSLHTSYALARPFKLEWNVRPLFSHFHVDRVIAAERTLLECMPFILANSDAIVADMEKTYGVSISGRTAVVPHGTFEPHGASVASIQAKCAALCEPKPIRIMYVGRFEPRKGFELACDAFRRILESGRNVALHFVGDVLTPASLAVVENAGARLLLNDPRVTFHGAVTRKALDELYLESDIVVMPSRYESFGLVAIEAMAAASPLIALKAGGLAEVVEDGVTGYLLDPTIPDGAAIYDAIRLLLDDPEKLRRMKCSARRAYETRFTIDRMVKGAESVFYAAAKGRTHVPVT